MTNRINIWSSKPTKYLDNRLFIFAIEFVVPCFLVWGINIKSPCSKSLLSFRKKKEMNRTENKPMLAELKTVKKEFKKSGMNPMSKPWRIFFSKPTSSFTSSTIWDERPKKLVIWCYNALRLFCNSSISRRERFLLCSDNSGMNNATMPAKTPAIINIVATTARIFGNLSFNLKNRTSGLPISATTAAIAKYAKTDRMVYSK